jgi:hypothetical protein
VFDSESRLEGDFDGDTAPRGINSNGGSFSPTPSMPMIAPGEGLGYILFPGTKIKGRGRRFRSPQASFTPKLFRKP